VGAVLIVDDHLPAALLLARLLRSAGHEAACAAGGEEAFRRLDANPADVIVLDVMMPEVDGLSVLRRLRSDPRFSSTRVLMYTALDDEAKCAEAMRAGAQGYMVKGSTPWPDLLATIDLHLPAREPAAPPAPRPP
jgi:DNA-binding response OmpR family regulator